jgi:type III secretion system FlhB-like substrate exporter
MVFFTCFDTITAYFGHKNSTLETVIENKKEYNNMRELIQYLRVMKFDSAIDYDIYPYIEEILTALYKTKLVTTEDILGKWA